MNAQERNNAFMRQYPNYAPLIVHNNRLYGTWIIGNWHKRNTNFYGAYPYKVKERLLALFPDCQSIMHLFSGIIQDLNTITYDINCNLKPTICDDVRNIKNHKQTIEKIDLCICDPPYESKDFEKYNLKPFNKRQVIKDLDDIMKQGSYLAWLDVIIPMYSKKQWNLLAHIGLVISTNTRVLMWSIWERV